MACRAPRRGHFRQLSFRFTPRQEGRPCEGAAFLLRHTPLILSLSKDVGAALAPFDKLRVSGSRGNELADRQHDLADVAALFHVGVGGRSLGQGKGAVHDRAQFAGGDERPDRLADFGRKRRLEGL